jgi:hypothetical protein
MDLLGVLDENARLRQLLLFTKRESDEHRQISEKRLAKARQGLVQLEQSRDELRSVVLELSEQSICISFLVISSYILLTVEASKSLSALPANTIYIPGPIQPFEPTPPKLLTHQDEAYLATILSTLTSELAHARSVNDENEKQYQMTVCFILLICCLDSIR